MPTVVKADAEDLYPRPRVLHAALLQFERGPHHLLDHDPEVLLRAFRNRNSPTSCA